MKEAFIEKNFSKSSQATIDIVNQILDEYSEKGYDLSLRQLYYQLVARGYIENSIQSYKRIGNLVNDGRLAGLIDWDMITDRGRTKVEVSHWGSPRDIVYSAARSFRIDKWQNQKYYVMVMVEKQALEGVLIPVCRGLDIPFIANKGYSSASAMYEIGKDLQHRMDRGKQIVMLYLGDHDPSGIDMTRDVQERLSMFSGCSAFEEVQVDRLALNLDQIEALNPPPNPAKESDARYEKYVKRYGETCWELDAIEPTQLAQIVERAVSKYRNKRIWDEAVAEETHMRDELFAMANQYKSR